MKPHLHPDMGQTVLCARVALQLTNKCFRRSSPDGYTPAAAARLAARNLPADYPGFLKFALHSLGVYLDLGMTSSEWLQRVLEASHFGSSFRRCFFFEYKEHRRPYPRVTNRGVQAPDNGRHARVRKGIPNA